jgi:hypothetical protein
MSGTLIATRLALHAVAEQVISALRIQATGNEIALCVRPGGFGTPELPGGGWVGTDGADVVRVAADGTEARDPLRSLRQAAHAVGLHTAEALSDDPLAIDAEAARLLATVWADGDAALRELSAALAPADTPSIINLWPEHFDIAIDAGDDDSGTRASYGVSPGDENHDAPYAYVAPWTTPSPRPPWQAVAFAGAERPAADPHTTVAFWQECRAELDRSRGPARQPPARSA